MITTAPGIKSDPSTRVIRTLIVEDQEVMRLGLQLTFQDSPDIMIVGEAADGPSAVSMALSMKPDLVLMDVGLPEFDGIVATQKIKAAPESPKILMLSSHIEDKAVFSALEAGADGYCLKDASKAQLLSAIRSVAAGGTWLSEDIAVRVLRSSLRAVDPESTNQHQALTQVETQILHSIFQGATVDNLSAELGIDNITLMGHTTRLLQKIACRKAVEPEESDSAKRRKITEEHELMRICESCHATFPISQESCLYDGQSTRVDELIGTVFADRYDILTILGSGTGGRVYKAKHKYMNKEVAIKIMHGEHLQDLELLRRFRQEAAAASAVQHKNIVSVLDFGFTANGEPFMIMDYLKSTSLSEIIDVNGPLAPAQAIEIFCQICEGLSETHRHGIIHRDLKPSNVLVSGFGTEKVVVRLADFGIAKLTRPIVAGQLVETEFGQVFGSPLYMSPEQCKGEELDQSSDIYSMGCLMYEALVGCPPVEGESAVEVMYKKAHEPIPHISTTERGANLPRLLQEVVMKTLRYKRDERFRSVEELRQILKGLVVD